MARKGPVVVRFFESRLWLAVCVGAAAACLSLAVHLLRNPRFIRLDNPGGVITLTLCAALGLPAALYGIIAAALLSRRSRRAYAEESELFGLRRQVRELEQVQIRQRARIDELATLRELAYVVNRESEFAAIAQTALELITGLLEPLEACIFLTEEPDGPLKPFAQQVDGKFLTGRKLLTRTIPNFHPAQFERHGIVCRVYGQELHAIIPLKVDQETLGVLFLVFPTDARSAKVQVREFNETRRALLQEIAQHLSLAVKTKDLHMKSVMDNLTRLFSKGQFDAQLEAHLELAARNGENLALLILDIDHFKRINDSYGHASGDVVLIGIAATIRRSLRKYDTGYRIGGEELAVLLPRTDLTKAVRVAERLRGRIENRRFTSKGRTRIHVTVSCGVAHYRKGDASASLFSRADKRLYEAKHKGRNRVIPSAA